MSVYHLPEFKEFPTIDFDATKLKLIELRKKSNLSRYDLAKILLVSYQAIANWENINSLKFPPINQLINLSRLYNCNLEDILIIKKSQLINGPLTVAGTVRQYNSDIIPYGVPTDNLLDKKALKVTTKFEEFIGKKAYSDGVALNGRFIICEHLFNFVDGYISDKYVDGKFQSYGIFSLTKKYTEHWKKGHPVSE